MKTANWLWECKYLYEFSSPLTVQETQLNYIVIKSITTADLWIRNKYSCKRNENNKKKTIKLFLWNGKLIGRNKFHDILWAAPELEVFSFVIRYWIIHLKARLFLFMFIGLSFEQLISKYENVLIPHHYMSILNISPTKNGIWKKLLASIFFFLLLFFGLFLYRPSLSW